MYILLARRGPEMKLNSEPCCADCYLLLEGVKKINKEPVVSSGSKVKDLLARSDVYGLRSPSDMTAERLLLLGALVKLYFFVKYCYNRFIFRVGFVEVGSSP